jgi:hypothetical protein
MYFNPQPISHRFFRSGGSNGVKMTGKVTAAAIFCEIYLIVDPVLCLREVAPLQSARVRHSLCVDVKLGYLLVFGARIVISYSL